MGRINDDSSVWHTWQKPGVSSPVVLDNLNADTIGLLFATYPLEEAWRLKHWLEYHHTPKHASWLNRAELELSVLPQSTNFGQAIELGYSGLCRPTRFDDRARAGSARLHPRVSWIHSL